MCHTWGLARSPAELQGGQGQGHQGVPFTGLPWKRREEGTTKIEIHVSVSARLKPNLWRAFCQTPDFSLGLGVDFTFPNNSNN